METYRIENFTFTYPGRQRPVLSDLDFVIPSGQFIALCGQSGCGKTTLLRQLKSILAPHGDSSGTILFEGRLLAAIGQREQAARIGFVQQSPDNQIVTDKVWHELAFGLESLGMDSETIRLKVAEMASFFGIQTWFHQNVCQLSGGQKQLLNLAAVMVMQPSVLILDEPTSQLDPIAAQEFLETLAKINRELGTTIVISEHRLEEVLPLSDRVLVLDEGRLIVDAPPKAAAAALKRLNHVMFAAMPTPIRVWAEVENDLPCPLTVREGRNWLEDFAVCHQIDEQAIPAAEVCVRQGTPAISLREISFRYEKDAEDVINNLTMNIYPGELYAIVGGNGAGKSTTVSLISGVNQPQRGKLLIEGKSYSQWGGRLYEGILGVLPQNPQALFVKKNLELDLYEMFAGRKLPDAEQQRRVAAVSRLCELDGLLAAHPYDLSGGEQQRAALAKVLLLAPRILILDEPTKGLDAHFKIKLAGILKSLQALDVTIVMVSHDIEFCATYADCCAMFFDGGVVAEHCPRTFFSVQRFYTTAANRMARQQLPQAVLTEDIIAACGGLTVSADLACPDEDIRRLFAVTGSNGGDAAPDSASKNQRGKIKPWRILLGILMAALFVFLSVYGYGRWTEDWRLYASQALIGLALVLALWAFIPGKLLSSWNLSLPPSLPVEKRQLSKRTLAALLMIVAVIPLTIYVGYYFFADRKYYFISLLIILETMLPFLMVFEGRKPQAREMVVIAVLVGIAVAGRAACFMIPSFKPVLALVIIAGICFGGEVGFLVGALTGFVSNFFFGQGPWTPWQMLGFGMVGFAAGILFCKGLLRKQRGSLCIFGGLAAMVIYGPLMDTATVLMYQANPTWPMILAAYGLGLPFNIVHAVATMMFLWLIAGSMIEKLERIKHKYGLLG